MVNRAGRAALLLAITAIALTANILIRPPRAEAAAAVTSVSPPSSDYGDPLVFDARHTWEARVQDHKDPTSGFATLLGQNVGEIQMRIFQAPDTSKSEIFELKRHADNTALLRLFPGENGSGLTLFVTGVGVASFGQGVADPGRSALLLLRREAVSMPAGPAEQWVVYLEGKRVYAFKPNAAIPGPTEQLEFVVGTPTSPLGLVPAPSGNSGTVPSVPLVAPPFHGSIDMLAVRTPQRLLYVQAAVGSAGMLRRVVPVLTSYLGVGQDPGVKKTDIAGISLDNHGIYQKATYYAVSPGALGRTGSRGIAVTADWGASYDLVPDLSDTARYIPALAAQAWAGSISFEDEQSDHRARFVAQEVYASGPMTWLQNGQKYITVAPRPEPRWNGETPFDASTGTPNKSFSATACYNILTMDLINFQHSGCVEDRPIFKTAPAGESRDKGGSNVPYGWSYQKAIVSKANAQHSFVSSAAELSSAYAGSTSKGFVAVIYGQSNNSSAESEWNSYSQFGRALEVEQSFATSSVLIIKPEEIQLADCFVLDTLRAAATLIANGRKLNALSGEEKPQPPSYYDAAGATKYCTDAGLDDPLTVRDFVARYGTHYAHATTYGARGFTKTSVIARELSNEVQSRKSNESETKVELDLKEIKAAGKIELSDKNESGSGGGSKTVLETKNTVVEKYCIGGDSCQGGDLVHIGHEPIPVYLDLRTFDHLFAPPFFTDLHVLRDLRQAVASEIDRQLAESAKRPTAPPVMRLIDVRFESQTCNYAAQTRDPSGAFRIDYRYLGNVCGLLPQNALLGGFAINSDDSVELLEFKLQHEGNTTPDAPDYATLLAGMFDSHAYWPNKPMPGFYEFSRCLEYIDRQCVVTPRFYFLLTPGLASVGKAAPFKKSLVLKLFPRANRGYTIDPTPTCDQDCAIRFEWMVDSFEGRQREYISWFKGPLNDPSRKLVPKALTTGLSDPIISERILSGRAATYRESSGLEPLGVDLSFRIQEEDLAGVFGYKAAVDSATREPRTLAAIAPNLQAVFRNNGGYLATYSINYTVAGTASGAGTPDQSFQNDSGNISLGNSSVFNLPFGATSIAVAAHAVGRIGGQPILQLQLANPGRGVCIETYGTVFAPQWRYCQ